MKIKYRIYFALFMSLLLSSLMTLWVTFINPGLVADFFTRWIHAFILAWPAAAVISFMFAPFIHWLVSQLVQRTSE